MKIHSAVHTILHSTISRQRKLCRNLEKFFKGFLNFYKIKQRKRIELIKLKILEIFPSALQTSARNEYTLCKDIKIIANLLNLVPLY